jgi:hypothetical protein
VANGAVGAEAARRRAIAADRHADAANGKTVQ